MRAGRSVAIGARVVMAVAGGYLFASGLVAMIAVVSAAALPRSEAAVLATMLGFPLYASVLIWAFASRRLRCLVAMTVIGLLAMAGALALRALLIGGG